VGETKFQTNAKTRLNFSSVYFNFHVLIKLAERQKTDQNGSKQSPNLICS